MAAAIKLSQTQEASLVEFLKDKTTLAEAEVLPFLEKNSLPWDNVPAFRWWCKENGFWEAGPKTSTGGTKTNSPTVRGINKFDGTTGAMSLAQILLQDKEKAIAGAITQLEEEIKEIQLECEQQISIIKAAAEERVAERETTISALRNELPGR